MQNKKTMPKPDNYDLGDGLDMADESAKFPNQRNLRANSKLPLLYSLN
jgi:hypothetical protein